MAKIRTVYWLVPLIVLLLIGAVCWIINFATNDSTSQKLQQAFRDNDHETVLLEAHRLLQSGRLDTTAAWLAAESGDRLSRPRDVIRFLRPLALSPQDPDSIAGRNRLAKAYIAVGLLSEAEQVLDELVHATDDRFAHWQLATLRAGVGRRFDAVAALTSLVQVSNAGLQEARLLLQHGARRWTPARLERLFRLQPNDNLVLHGLITQATLRRDSADTSRLLKKANLQVPHLRRLQLQHQFQTPGVTTELLRELKQAWMSRRPSEVHPDLLLLLAEVSHAVGQPQIGLSCLRQCLQDFPFQPSALNLAATLAAKDSADAAAQFRQLAHDVELLAGFAAELDADDRDRSQTYVQIVQNLYRMGRLSEARIWARELLQTDHYRKVAEKVLSADQEPSFDHPRQWLPHYRDKAITEWLDQLQPPSDTAGEATIRLIDVADQTGLKFAFDNGRRFDDPGLRMHEWTGGGIGVIDIDGDAWPDLALTQGIISAPASAAVADDQRGPQPHHRLFRNRRGGRWNDVSSALPAGLQSFGQGVAVGDVNNDGFPDLYIASTTANLLLMNMGDGTFVESPFGDDRKQWTTSCAIADLNADGWPDLYVVNYIDDDAMFTQRCEHEGRLRICAPTDFRPATDEVWLNSGDGSFRAAEQFAGLQSDHAASSGMGLLIGRFDANAAGNSVYVANDEYPNQLWNLRSDSGNWQDQALARGVAVDGSGRPMGSMGIAMTHHADRRQIFVTNYFSEANDLFREVIDGTYVAAAAESGLAAAGFNKLGFGTQFADLNGDGADELFVANGHLDDFTFLSHPYRMSAQLFTSTQNRFQEVHAGPYFDQKWVGRSVATCDWNRDARPDLVVGHLYDPVSLLENGSTSANVQAGLQLIATQSARDAVGSHLQLTAFGKTLLRQVTAGDGYQACNQKRLHIAFRATDDQIATVATTPSATTAPTVTIAVEWSGSRSTSHALTMAPLSSDSLAIVEGRTEIYCVPQ